MAGLLGTSVDDQDFYSRKLQDAAKWISAFQGQRSQKKQLQEQREQEELDFALRTIQQRPELAKTFGADIVQRYGAKYPMAASLITAMQQPDELQQQIQQGGEAWTNNWRQMRTDYSARQAAAQAMPDYQPMPEPASSPGLYQSSKLGPAFSPQFSPPNPEKERALNELKKQRPELFSLQALQALDPAQQGAARLYAKSRGIPIPEEFDPYDQLPGDQVALYASQAGQLDPQDEVVRAQRYKAGLEQDPARLQEQGFQTDERVKREAATSAQTERKATLNLERMDVADTKARSRAVFQDGLIRGRAESGFQRSKELIDYRGRSSSGAAWKGAMDASGKVISDYDARLRQATQGLDSRRRDEAIKKFQIENGQRPKLITGLTMKNVQQKITEMSAGDQDTYDKMMSRVVTDMMGGESEEDALANAQDLYGDFGSDDDGDELHSPSFGPDQKMKDRIPGLAGEVSRSAKERREVSREEIKAKIKAKAEADNLNLTPAELEEKTNEVLRQYNG